MSDCRNPHLSAYERAAQEDRERSRAADSREKLEEDSQEKIDADLRGLLLLLVNDVANTAYEQTFDKHLKVDAWWNAFVKITDRQAAITRMEDECACHDCTIEQVEVLQEQVDELTAERDEWKANAEQARESYLDAKHDRDAWHELYVNREGSSSVSRAAAVKRLRECRYLSTSDLMCAVVGFGHEPHTGEQWRDALIDLLEDEPMDARRDNDGTCPDADGTASVAQDSREKLEADILAWRGKPASIVDMIPVWLDRQAAITTQECNDVYGSGCEACRSSQKRKIAELQEQLDIMRDVTREFRDERDEWKAKAKKRDFKDEMADLLFRIQIPLNVQREYLKKVSQDSEMDSRERLEAEIRYEYNGSISNEAEQIIEWLDRQAAITKMEMQAKVDELEAKRASWTCCYHNDRLAKLQAQRDRYRDLLSKAVDEAQGIVKLMEVES